MITVKKGLFDTIKYNGKTYKRVNESKIGDIALCLGRCQYTTEGNYYPIIECYPPNGFKGIIADDGDPMGIHDVLGGFKYYRAKKLI